jgi:hypothetical protein
VHETGPPIVRAGLYRGRVAETEGRTRRFQMLLFAALPDRLHAELLSPLGGTELVVDGGGGRLAVAVVGERVVFTGSAGARALEPIVGGPLSLADLVRALVTADPAVPSGCKVRREAAAAWGLPRTFEITCGGRELLIELRRSRALREPAAGLGTGVVAGDFEVRDLDELRWEWFELRDSSRTRDRGR